MLSVVYFVRIAAIFLFMYRLELALPAATFPSPKPSAAILSTAKKITPAQK